MIVSFLNYAFFIMAAKKTNYLAKKQEVNDDLVFDFCEYVKCQLDVSTVLNKERSLDSYAGIYRWFEHGNPDYSELNCVLRWFYHDLAFMFFNSVVCGYMLKYEFDVAFCEKIHGIKTTLYSISQEREELEKLSDLNYESKYRNLVPVNRLKYVGLSDRVVQSCILYYMSDSCNCEKLIFGK